MNSQFVYRNINFIEEFTNAIRTNNVKKAEELLQIELSKPLIIDLSKILHTIPVGMLVEFKALLESQNFKVEYK